jgi:Acetyltransferase (GNAT) domain
MIELLRAGDPAWNARLESAPRDVYHTAGFHEYSAYSGEGEPFLVVVTEEDRGLIWPYLLRPIAQVDGLAGADDMDVGSVYGYPGPVAWGCSPGHPFVARAGAAIRDVWRDQRAVSAFTRFNPLLGNATLAADLAISMGAGPPADSLVPGGATVSIDCRLDDEAAQAQYARVLRQEIATASKAGFTTQPDEDWLELESFVRLYRATMDRSGAARYYFLQSDDVHRLRAALDGRIHLLVTRLDDTVGAIGLFTEYNGIVQAHLVGTNDELRRYSPLKILLDDARRWAMERGNKVLHLGGGRGGQDDSLFAFKARFSSRRHFFYTGQWILDPARYRELEAAHAGVTAEASGTRFFPSYRAPRSQASAGPSQP